jgi:hypothetical protein
MHRCGKNTGSGVYLADYKYETLNSVPFLETFFILNAYSCSETSELF